MSTVTLEEAQARLGELIALLKPGEQLRIKEGDRALATLVREAQTSWPCQPGSAKDLPHWMAPDFDAPLDDFRDYM